LILLGRLGFLAIKIRAPRIDAGGSRILKRVETLNMSGKGRRALRLRDLARTRGAERIARCNPSVRDQSRWRLCFDMPNAEWAGGPGRITDYLDLNYPTLPICGGEIELARRADLILAPAAEFKLYAALGAGSGSPLVTFDFLNLIGSPRVPFVIWEKANENLFGCLGGARALYSMWSIYLGLVLSDPAQCALGGAGRSRRILSDPEWGGAWCF